MMKNTGVFATEEEFAELKKLRNKAARTPVIALSSAQALSGRDSASVAWQRVKERCHALALEHGLPEVQGFYGIDGTKEFLES